MPEFIHPHLSADKDALVYFWNRKTKVSKNLKADKYDQICELSAPE